MSEISLCPIVVLLSFLLGLFRILMYSLISPPEGFSTMLLVGSFFGSLFFEDFGSDFWESSVNDAFWGVDVW